MVSRSFLRRKLGFISKSMFLFNMLAIVALLISYSASFVDPNSFWPVAFFGLGYLPILLVNIAFIAYWVLRKPRIALYSLLVILAGWPLLTRHFGFRFPSEIAVNDSTNLRLMTFNAHLFKTASLPERDFKEDVIAILDSVQPDVVCFQEYYSKIKGKKIFAEKLKKECGYPYNLFDPSEMNDYEGYGPSLFSKYPIVNSGHLDKANYGINRISFVDIKKNNQIIRIYNVHLRSFSLGTEDKKFIQHPSAQASDESKNSKRIGRKLKSAFKLRSEQANTIRTHMNACPYPYLVAGDFNDTPMSYAVNLIGKDMQNAFQKKGSGWGVTHYDLLPIFQIDYIFASKDLKVMDYQIVKKKLSDHYPIWADFRFSTDH